MCFKWYSECLWSLWVWIPGYLCRVLALDVNFEWDCHVSHWDECEFVSTVYPSFFWKIWTFQGQIVWHLLLNVYEKRGYWYKQSFSWDSEDFVIDQKFLWYIVVSEQVCVASFCEGLSVLVSGSKIHPHLWKSTYWNF